VRVQPCCRPYTYHTRILVQQLTQGHIYLEPLGWGDVSRPLKARHPDKTSWVTGASPLNTSHKSPGSRHVTAAPNQHYLLHPKYLHPLSFRLPSTTLFRSRSTMETRLLVQTRSCRTGKDCPRAHVLEVDEGEVERRISVRKSTRKYLYPPRSFYQPLDKHKHPSAVKCDTCVQKQGLAWCARAGSGEGRGVEERRGCGAVMRGWWTIGRPFIRLSGSPVVTVT
jgi:hypothetical protein